MENEYSKLYDETYNKVYSEFENEIKKVIIDQYKKYSGFQTVFDLVYKDINTKIDDLYINQSDKFKKVIDWYLVRYDVKREDAIYLIYEDQMSTEFKLIEGIKSNYTYLSFIGEFATNHALVEISRLWYYSRDIYKLMYDVNYFDDFRICKEYYGHPEHRIEFKKLVYKKRIEEYPDEYNSFEEYLEKEEAFNIAYNNLNFQNNRINRKPKIMLNNFDIKKEHKNAFLENAYKVLSNEQIFNEDGTYYEDFENVFTKDWDKHNSRLYFDCSTEEAGLLIFYLKKYFKNLTFASVHRSELFYSYDQILLKEDNLSKSKKNANKEDEKNIKNILEQIFLFRSE